MITASQRYYAAHKEICNKRSRENYRKSRERTLSRQRKRREEKPWVNMLASAKVRAKKLRLPFDIEAADIEIPEFCPVLGMPLAMGTGQGPVDASPSLDRIIPERGYVRGNVRVISFRANALKRDGTPEELLRVAEYAASTQMNLADYASRSN